MFVCALIIIGCGYRRLATGLGGPLARGSRRRKMIGAKSYGTARLALEDNGHDSSALLWTFVRERPEGSGRELFAFCCPYRFFIDAQTKARTVW